MKRPSDASSWAIGDPIFLRGRSVHDGPEVLDRGNDAAELLRSTVKRRVRKVLVFDFISINSARLVLGWVTVLVCKFLVIVFWN